MSADSTILKHTFPERNIYQLIACPAAVWRAMREGRRERKSNVVCLATWRARRRGNYGRGGEER